MVRILIEGPESTDALRPPEAFMAGLSDLARSSCWWSCSGHTAPVDYVSD